jgi:hypothetical protein
MPSALVAHCGLGQDAPTQSFEVWNCGYDVLEYAISDGADWYGIDWLSCSPDEGTSSGERDVIACEYATAWLPCGSYEATIQITDPNAGNDPQTIPVNLMVHCAPSICYSAIPTVSCPMGHRCAASFEVWSCGTGVLAFEITGGAEWLSYYPRQGFSTGADDKRTIILTYDTAGLGEGRYKTLITISDPNAGNNPQAIQVGLDVGPPGPGIPPPPWWDRRHNNIMNSGPDDSMTYRIE